MGITVIPETFRYKCDGCGAEHIEKIKVRWPLRWGILTLAHDAHDYQGRAVADATTTNLLCVECLSAVEIVINNAIEAKQKKVP